MIRLLLVITSLLSIAAVEIPPLHRIVHTEDINSDRVFVSDITYDSLGRRISEVNGVLDPDDRGRHRHQGKATFTTTIRYAGDSMISAMTNGSGAPRILTLVLDSLGNYIGAGSHVRYDASGHVTEEADTNYETHIIMRGADVAERYGWSRYAGTDRHYRALYTYYPEYDTRSYGTTGGRQEAGHLLHTATYIYSGEQSDTIETVYSYDFGTDGRVLTERRTERRSSASHPDYWTARYTYED